MNRGKTGKKSLSWLLALSMVLSLFGGGSIVPQKAKAVTGDATINFGDAKVSSSGYYTYPDVKVTIPDATKRIHNLTVTVDSGYIKVTDTTIEDIRGTKVTGKGILTTESIQEREDNEGNSGMSAGSTVENLSKDSTSRYEAVSFDFDGAYGSGSISPGAEAAEVEKYLGNLRFTTSKTGNQTVTITATTLGNSDLKADVNGREIELHYYNGHFYGYVDFANPSQGIWWASGNWKDAYLDSQKSDFKGIKGYLATLTSRGEDRFLYSTFPLNDSADNKKSKKGWIGCTRADMDFVTSDATTTTLPEMTSQNDLNFIWRWATGPEAGTEFGQQTAACGTTWGEHNDGGFKAFDGYFENWGKWTDTEHNDEPNGGIKNGTGEEGFGYYGQYDYGRWNDWSLNQPLAGYFIEFGGMDGDDDTLKKNLGDEIIVTEKKNEPGIVNPDATPTPAPTKDPNASVTPDASATPEGTIDPNATADPDASAVPSAKPTAGTEVTDSPKPSEAPKKKLTGTPVIKQVDEGDIEEGTRLKADTSDVGPKDALSHITYVWYKENKNTKVWEEIPGAAGKDIFSLTKDTIDHNIKVEVVGKDDYEDSVLASKPFDATHTKIEIQTISIEKKNSKDKLESGTVLKAKLDELVIPADDEIGSELHYQWYVVDEDGTATKAGKDEMTYVIRPEDMGKKIQLKVTARDESEKYTGTSVSKLFEIPAAPVVTSTPSASDEPVVRDITGKPIIESNTTDTDGTPINKIGTILTADVDRIGPKEARDSLIYQWYIKETDGSLTPIDGANDKTIKLTESELDKKLVVSVTGNRDAGYNGTRNSNPYESTQTKTSITGTPKIINETKGKDLETGKSYEVKREGTILTADVDGISPEGSRDSLTYQWYIKDSDGKMTPIQDATDKSYVLTSDEVDKELVVEVTGNGKYKGSKISDGYDTTRTDADVKIEDDGDGHRNIVVSPTMKDTVYAIVDASDKEGKPLLDVPTIDAKGMPVSPSIYTDELPGYYMTEPGGKLTFTVDKDKEYIIYARKETSLDVVVVGPEIKDVTVKDYDDKNTSTDNEDDTVSIEVNPADVNYQYAILKKQDGKYYDLTVKYDEAKGEYVYDKDAKNSYLTKGNEGRVTFSNLPADGTYKVVAIPNGKTLDDEIFKGLTPSQIQGGSEDIVSSAKPLSPDADGTKDPTATATSTPAAPTATPVMADATVPTAPAQAGSSLTPEQESRVDKFVNEHGKDPSGNMINKVDELTKDIITSGEPEWNKMSAEEQAAVNQRLKDGGCPYTYPQLLEMANAYKIPGFKLHKVMKKGTKSKLKLMKCKGATIIVTSTNKKVAVVNKKGVIKAKKKGKATLTITAVKGKYSNRLVINVDVRKKFKNAKELKKFKSNRIKTPTILIAKKRQIKKSTRIKIYGLEKNAKVKYLSYNKKALPLNKKGRYTAKKKGKSLMRVKVKQNDKTYLLYLYVTAYK